MGLEELAVGAPNETAGFAAPQDEVAVSPLQAEAHPLGDPEGDDGRLSHFYFTNRIDPVTPTVLPPPTTTAPSTRPSRNPQATNPKNWNAARLTNP